MANAHLSGAHELAHTFLCGDEYGGTLALAGLDPTGPCGNLQAIADLTAFDAATVRWSYPRIRAAGLLIRDLANPKQTDKTVEVKLPKAHVAHIAGAFSKDEIAANKAVVFLRKRPLTKGCWGLNSSGEVDGTTTERLNTVPVAGLTNVAAISIGADGHHTCALLKDGTVWCWGSNLTGQLGVGDESPRSTPTKALLPCSATRLASWRAARAPFLNPRRPPWQSGR